MITVRDPTQTAQRRPEAEEARSGAQRTHALVAESGMPELTISHLKGPAN